MNLEYPWVPHEVVPISRRPQVTNTREEMIELIRKLVPSYLPGNESYHIDDLYHMVIQNGLKHNTNIVTRALSEARIPESARITNDTLNYLIALQYEKELGLPEVLSLAENSIFHSTIRQKYHFDFSTISYKVSVLQRQWTQNAIGVTEIIKAWEAIGTNFSVLLEKEQADYVRRAGLVYAGNLTGMKIETLANPMVWRYKGGTVPLAATIPANKEVITRDFIRMNQIEPGNRVNQTDGIKLTALNGPLEISWIGNTATTVLAKDAEQTIDNAEFTSKVTLIVKPIEKPEVIGSLQDISLTGIGSETFSYANLFSGIRVQISVSSSKTNVATVAKTVTDTAAVQGVATGTTEITVTGTNEAGSASVTFNVTITE